MGGNGQKIQNILCSLKLLLWDAFVANGCSRIQVEIAGRFFHGQAPCDILFIFCSMYTTIASSQLTLYMFALFSKYGCRHISLKRMYSFVILSKLL